jgi:hypothetical protein
MNPGMFRSWPLIEKPICGDKIHSKLTKKATIQIDSKKSILSYDDKDARTFTPA